MTHISSVWYQFLQEPPLSKNVHGFILNNTNIHIMWNYLVNIDVRVRIYYQKSISIQGSSIAAKSLFCQLEQGKSKLYWTGQLCVVNFVYVRATCI